MDRDRKAAIVTGAARRVGAAIARTLAAAGYDMVLHYRHSRAEAEALAEEIARDLGATAVLADGDLADPALPGSLVERTRAAFGRLDAMVNNASIYCRTPFGETGAAQWDEVLNVNLRAPFLLAQAGAPWLRETGGAIVNIADIYGERPLAGYLPYSVAKAGLIMLTKALAKELGPAVRVNSVSPGVVLWAEAEAPAEGNRQSILSRTALKRAGTPEDVAAAVRYLLLDAPYVTGHNLVLDGGRGVY